MLLYFVETDSQCKQEKKGTFFFSKSYVKGFLRILSVRQRQNSLTGKMFSKKCSHVISLYKVDNFYRTDFIFCFFSLWYIFILYWNMHSHNSLLYLHLLVTHQDWCLKNYNMITRNCLHTYNNLNIAYIL